MKSITGWRVYVLMFAGMALVGCASMSSDMYSMRDASMPFGAEMLADAAPSDSAADSEAASERHTMAADLATPKDRLVIYYGSVALLVESIAEQMDRMLVLVKEAGGYMQSLNDKVVVVKIPAAQFGDVVARIERLGEVTHKNIVGEDVTDQMRDFQIRLKNAEQIRDRLAALLDRAEKVEDALKIERELGRVTEGIELLKGQIQMIANRIAFSTLTVTFNSPLPQQTVKQEIPFPWVLQLGGDMVTGSRGRSRYHSAKSRRRVKFDLPESFAKYEEDHYRTRAMSADGVFLKVERHDNVEGGDLTFWTTFIKRALAARRALRVTDAADIEIHGGKAGVMLSAAKEIGAKPHRYLVAVTQTDKYVVTYEAWGPAEAFKNAETAIRKSVMTVRL